MDDTADDTVHTHNDGDAEVVQSSWTRQFPQKVAHLLNRRQAAIGKKFQTVKHLGNKGMLMF